MINCLTHYYRIYSSVSTAANAVDFKLKNDKYTHCFNSQLPDASTSARCPSEPGQWTDIQWQASLDTNQR